MVAVVNTANSVTEGWKELIAERDRLHRDQVVELLERNLHWECRAKLAEGKLEQQQSNREEV